MNIQAQKIELAQLIFNTNDKSVLKKVKEALLSSKDSLLDDLHDDVRKSVEVSLKQLKNGEYVSHEEVMKKHKKWLKK